MALKVPNQGENILHELIRANMPACTLRLFKNNVTPADADQSQNTVYTEATFTGYAAQALGAGAAVATVNGKASTTFPQLTFTCTGGAAQDIYGYYITRDSDGKYLWAERDPNAPFNFTGVNGQTYRVTPVLTLSSEA